MREQPRQAAELPAGWGSADLIEIDEGEVTAYWDRDRSPQHVPLSRPAKAR